MKFRDDPQSGSRGNTVASRNRFGPFQRERVSPDHPGTAAQQGVWGSMAELSWLWNHLPEEQWPAWRKLALQVRSRPNMGNSAPLDAAQLFKKINRVLATCGREPLIVPPPLPEFGPNPVEGFEVRAAKDRLVFKLRVSRNVRWEARPPLEDIMVYAWAPCNPPVEKPRNWAFLGILPAPRRGESDITELYLRKLKEWRKLQDRKYHVPLEGSRVFVRAWQQTNGWENESAKFLASALVPVGGR
jgi:hypothetical protein